MIQSTDLTIADSGGWRLTTLIGLPVGILGVAVSAVVFTLLVRAYLRSRGERWATMDGPMLGLGSIGVLAVLIPSLLLAVAGVWPLDTRYLQWRDVTGTVEEVESRLIPAGDGMAERYVVTLDGIPFGIDDTRAALLEPGDTVELACHLEWQYSANDGYVCRWGGEQK